MHQGDGERREKGQSWRFCLFDHQKKSLPKFFCWTHDCLFFDDRAGLPEYQLHKNTHL
jgi:hypothetical protein